MPRLPTLPATRAVAALLLMVPAALAMAADLATGAPPERGMGLSLHAARDETRLENSLGGVGMRLSRIGLVLSETAGDNLSLGLVGGYLSATQADHPLTAGMRFTGNYLGVNMHGHFPLVPRLDLGFTAQFIYHWMKDEVAGQTVELDWAQTDLAAILRGGLTDRLSLYGGPRYSDIDVEQRARGGVTGSERFRARRSAGLALGLLLEVDHRGWVGLEWRRGATDGVALSFLRRF